MASPAINTRFALRELRHTVSTPVQVENSLNIEGISPTPSPEEQVIQQRGRRQLSHMNIQSFMLTPPKVMKSPKKLHFSSTPTRSSPRKRLNMNPIETITVDTPPSTPVASTKLSKNPKQMKIQRKINQNNLTSALKALSASQLIDIVTEMVKKHPDLKEDISAIIPPPDLKPLEDRLNYLQRNIYKSMPNSRWGSKTDSFCYRRVATHLDAFKKECLNQGRQLIESEQWSFVIEYVTMAFSYVDGLPTWDNPTHNKSKQMCFKGLSSQLLNALKKERVSDVTQLQEIHDRLQEFTAFAESVNTCMKYIKGILNK